MKRAGWRYESSRHSLAARGIKTRYQMKFPGLVKPFPGENPRVTTDFARFRQENPQLFVEGSFRTKKLSNGNELVLGVEKKSGNFVIQSVLLDRKKYFARRIVEKKGKTHVTKSGEEVIRQAYRVEDEIAPFVVKSDVVGSIRRGVKDPVDIDIVVVPRSLVTKEKLLEKLRSKSSVVYAEGSSRFSGRIDGVKTEVHFARPEEYGAALLTWTGPFDHNIGLRRVAQRQGLLLNEKGLFVRSSGERLAGKSEREIYRTLKRPMYKGPEERG